MNIRLQKPLINVIPRSIRGMLLLYFTAGTVLLFIIMGLVRTFGLPFGIYQGEMAEHQYEAMKRLNAVADDKKSDITEWFNERLGDLQLMVHDQINIDRITMFAESYREGRVEPQTLLELRSLLDNFKETSRYDSIEIVDAKTSRCLFSTDSGHAGAVCVVAGKLSGGGQDWTVRVFFDASANDNGTYFYIAHRIKPVSHDINIQLPVLYVLARVNVENSYLNYLIHGSSALGETGEIVLVDSERTLLAPLKHDLPNGSIARPLSYKIAAKPAELASMGIDSILMADDYRGEPVIAAVRHYRITPDYGIGLVIKQDQTEILAPLKRSIISLVVMSMISLIAVVCCLFLVARWLFTPLEKMTETVRRIETGDLGARVAVTSSDEIGILGKTFNEMAERIQGWYEELDALVRERTRELSLVNSQLNSEIEERIRAEKIVLELNVELEERVQQRTAELESANDLLLQNDERISRLNLELEHHLHQVTEANRELEAFNYSVSHDLRAPLRHLAGFVELLQKKDLSSLDEKGRHYLTVISDAAQRMGCLVDDLLSFSRMGRAEMSRFKVDLRQLTDEIVSELDKGETPEKAVTWVINDLPNVIGDSSMLRQVLINLLSNAQKYTRPGIKPVIEVGSGAAEHGMVQIYVRDNGIGFDMKYVDKLFSLFQRLHSPEEYEGTGVGLANVRRIINRHGGKTWAEGVVDEGATFYFTLPRA